VSERGPDENLPRVKARLPFGDRPATPGGARGAAARRAGVIVYGALIAILIGVAYYMAAVQGHPLTSPYVAAPAVGAAWFALRLLMTMAPRG
jgi:hypothetical protein